MTNPRCILLDASCLLSLYATGRLHDIAATMPYRFGVADYVLEQEALYTWIPDPDGGGEQREPVDLSSLVGEGLIQVMPLERAAEQLTFIDLAAQIDDGEAVTGALAFHRGCSVATDDRKARRVLQELVPGVPLVSTLELFKLWAEQGSVTDVELRSAMLAMQTGASYVPGSRDPLYSWWQQIMQEGHG